jgi:hypothetical protein
MWQYWNYCCLIVYLLFMLTPLQRLYIFHIKIIVLAGLPLVIIH